MPRYLKPITGPVKKASLCIRRPLWRKIIKHLQMESEARGYSYTLTHFLTELATEFFNR